jgi:hypothetical protein
MSAMNPLNVLDVALPPADTNVALTHAQHKRQCYPWNDWGRRILYADLVADGAACIDAWADPAFISPHTGIVGVWLRAEVWLHPDGTAYRTVLDARGTIVVPPLECCTRPHGLPEGILLPMTLVPPALRAHDAVEVTP